MKVGLGIVCLSIVFGALWFTPDQQGQREFRRGEFTAAAEAFEDPMWQGAAFFRAGEFEKAEQAFAKRSSAEARFNRGNALLMMGQYEDAIRSYDQALAARPDWKEAFENRQLAAARKKKTDQEGGEMGDQKIGADDVVFSRNKQPRGEETEITAEQAATDTSIQAMWLRRVQTKPADFLRSKFAYQNALESEVPSP